MLILPLTRAVIKTRDRIKTHTKATTTAIIQTGPQEVTITEEEVEDLVEEVEDQEETLDLFAKSVARWDTPLPIATFGSATTIWALHQTKARTINSQIIINTLPT